MKTPYESFSMEELSCSCCGKMEMAPSFMHKLVAISKECGYKLPVSSGYRCPIHDAVVSVDGSGAHVTGHAVDIPLDRGKALFLIGVALKHGITGIGVSQKGTKRFLHLDDLTSKDISPRNGKAFFRPTIWSY